MQRLRVRGSSASLVAALAVAAVIATVAASQPQAAERNPYRDRIGLASHTTFMSDRDAAAYVRRAADIGIRWLREDFSWSIIEPRSKGQFNWRITDRLMRDASRAGVNVVAVLGYAPSWANGGHSDNKYPPLKARDYADVAAAVARRYGKGGQFWAQHRQLKPRPLRAIELWNEPWHWSFWKPEPNDAAYADLVRLAARAVKARHPEIKLLVSIDLQVTYSDNRDFANGTHRNWEYGFLARLLRRNFGFASIDGYAVHPYSGHFGPYQTEIPGYADRQAAQQWLYEKLLLIRDMLTKANRMKPLWSTELGWSTNGDVDEQTQAEYLHDALKRAVEEWHGFVARSFVYVLEKPHNGDYAGAYNLLHDDLSPKEAWTALRQLLEPG